MQVRDGNECLYTSHMSTARALLRKPKLELCKGDSDHVLATAKREDLDLVVSVQDQTASAYTDLGVTRGGSLIDRYFAFTTSGHWYTWQRTRQDEITVSDYSNAVRQSEVKSSANDWKLVRSPDKTSDAEIKGDVLAVYVYEDSERGSKGTGMIVWTGSRLIDDVEIAVIALLLCIVEIMWK